MKNSVVTLLCGIGCLLVIAGFIVDGLNSPQQHSAFSPLGITLYAIGAVVFAVSVTYILRSRKSGKHSH